jgi:hypothetical protein
MAITSGGMVTPSAFAIFMLMPPKVRGQTRPLVGFVYAGVTSSEPVACVDGFRQGLKEAGFSNDKT